MSDSQLSAVEEFILGNVKSDRSLSLDDLIAMAEQRKLPFSPDMLWLAIMDLASSGRLNQRADFRIQAA